MVIVWRRRDRRLRRWLREHDEAAGADLHQARLVAMDLRHKNLREVNLRFADLTEADLRGADLRGADLEGAYLTGAICNGTDFGGASLRWTYLIATDLGRALLHDTDLTRAVYDQATSWPPGFVPPRSDAGPWHGASS